MKTYATSREIMAAQAAQDDGEDLSARQTEILRADLVGALVVCDTPSWRESDDCQPCGGGYMVTRSGSYRENFTGGI